jgi:hypothetical protein
VDGLRVRPLGKLSYEVVAERLANRTGISLTSGFLARSWRLMVFYFTCERYAPAGTGDLSFLVAALEGREPKDAGNRCRVLAPAVEKTYAWVRMSIIMSMFFLPALETAFVCSALQVMRISVPRLLPMLLFPAFMPLNALWITPIFSIALALVYYRSRQAEGEDVSLGAIVSTRL